MENQNMDAIEAIRKKYSPVVTRVPVFNADGSAHCVIHKSILYKFISDQCCKDGSSQVTKPIDLTTLTLEGLLADEATRSLVVESIAFVPPKATLADAKAAMDGVEHCQDVFITEKALSKKPVLGWLTNVDIDKNIEP